MKNRCVMAYLAMMVVIAVHTGPAFSEEDYTLEVLDKAPPEDLAEDIRKLIAPKAYRIANSEGPVFDFWLAAEIPVKALGDTVKKSLENIEQVTLLGVAVVHQEDHYDFKDDPIDPGLYAMRMALQPQDGDHMGTAPFDTFAILVPHDRDSQLFEDDPPDPEILAELSSKGTVGEHPNILSIQPLENADGEFPRLTEGGDDWKFLCLQLPVKAGTETATLSVQVVYEGIGDL